jgi:putative pyruvate formate lyase activating enzyme
VATLAGYRACPRDCGVNRIEDRWVACKTGRYAVVSSFFPHFGEEDCLRGWNGSGAIFFAHCNLRCIFCQNFDISQDVKLASQRGSTPREIAIMMLWLQGQGCHNINFVTPEHVAPQVVEAVSDATARGLHLPIGYNTSAYDALESLAPMSPLETCSMPSWLFM